MVTNQNDSPEQISKNTNENPAPSDTDDITKIHHKDVIDETTITENAKRNDIEEPVDINEHDQPNINEKIPTAKIAVTEENTDTEGVPPITETTIEASPPDETEATASNPITAEKISSNSSILPFIPPEPHSTDVLLPIQTNAEISTSATPAENPNAETITDAILAETQTIINLPNPFHPNPYSIIHEFDHEPLPSILDTPTAYRNYLKDGRSFDRKFRLFHSHYLNGLHAHPEFPHEYVNWLRSFRQSEYYLVFRSNPTGNLDVPIVP